MATSPPLSQAVGYGVVIGLGFLFALGMILTTYVLKRYQNEVQTSEMFATAGRTVKSGLVSSAVVSSWTWAATLLQSSGVAYRYGVSGPFWYASGATVQILLFATLAIELKRKAPNAHTFLEVIRARYGVYTHIVYIVFGLMTNILVTAMLLTGGSAVVTSLTGMPTAAACFLLPVGVVLYTVFGGIKATFFDRLRSYFYDLLVQAAQNHPVDGNEGSSYLTMRSKEGAIFFVINIVGNFGTVFMDNGYYNKAIAASPVHALPGYVMGGLSWFAIPWLAATTMGLSALALETNPVFPTFPDRMPDADVTAGLVLPNTAIALLGKGGAAATLLLIFMAVTSASSAEYIAVSSIFTYDIYKTYFEPTASGRKLVYMAHTSVVVYAILLAGFSTALYYIGISMGYLYLMMGVIISSAVLPAALTLLWSDQNIVAATLSPILGLVCSLIAWLVTAKKQHGDLSVASTGSNNPMLAGNVVALLSPLIFVPVLTFAFGRQKYDFVSMAMIRLGDDSDVAAAARVDLELIPGAADVSDAELLAEKTKLRRASLIAKTMTGVLTLALLVLWPMPLYGTGYIFSKKFFTGWVSVGIIWLFCSSFCVGLYPLFEGRHSIAHTFKGIVKDLTGKGKPPIQGRMSVVDAEKYSQDGKSSQDHGISTKEDIKQAEAVAEAVETSGNANVKY
ncbi:MAG: hypothetical protein LQ343_005980 [Gyalolechia ehrenbergii]|nr:MAG: hypothetical protein LQ343_005980 [Gyalolechia ehrenbergii]